MHFIDMQQFISYGSHSTLDDQEATLKKPHARRLTFPEEEPIAPKRCRADMEPQVLTPPPRPLLSVRSTTSVAALVPLQCGTPLP
jgi:hypothetical protein